MKINPEKLTSSQLKEIKKILIIQQKPFGDRTNPREKEDSEYIKIK